MTEVAALRANGFEGFLTADTLRRDWTAVPALPGVYCVVTPDAFAPVFRPAGTGGHFKGADPNVSVATLSARWVPASRMLYVGKAGAGAKGRRGLRRRLREYADFGSGRPVGHWGGRYVWQLRDSAGLLFAWKVCTEDPRAVEAGLLRSFHHTHGTLPFANLRF